MLGVEKIKGLLSPGFASVWVRNDFQDPCLSLRGKLTFLPRPVLETGSTLGGWVFIRKWQIWGHPRDQDRDFHGFWQPENLKRGVWSSPISVFLQRILGDLQLSFPLCPVRYNQSLNTLRIPVRCQTLGWKVRELQPTALERFKVILVPPRSYNSVTIHWCLSLFSMSYLIQLIQQMIFCSMIFEHKSANCL